MRAHELHVFVRLRGVQLRVVHDQQKSMPQVPHLCRHNVACNVRSTALLAHVSHKRRVPNAPPASQQATCSTIERKRARESEREREREGEGGRGREHQFRHTLYNIQYKTDAVDIRTQNLSEHPMQVFAAASVAACVALNRDRCQNRATGSSAAAAAAAAYSLHAASIAGPFESL